MALVDLNDSIIAQVRSAADLVDFVSQVTPLKLAGKSYKGLCPFHREKTPSFHVDRDNSSTTTTIDRHLEIILDRLMRARPTPVPRSGTRYRSR